MLLRWVAGMTSSPHGTYGLMLLAAGCLGGGCDKDRPEAMSAKRATAAAAAPVHAGKTQLVAVVSSQWDAFQATLYRYAREPGESWRPVGKPFEVVIGREGYGWGRGLHGTTAPQGRPGPSKREGDGRSPAGVFDIGSAYGYAPTREELSLPYRQANADLRCVDDPRSSHYNRIVSVEDTTVDWQSAERMRRDDDLYMLAIVVGHNTDETRPGSGSCIFIHLWEGPDRGMSGCTALPQDALDELARWLKPDAAVLIALPRVEYETLKRPWELPRLQPISRRSP